MKKLVSISLLIGFMAMALKPIGPYFEYLLNQDFIANNYCVNQDRPALQCNGKCYLMNRIKEQSDLATENEVFQMATSVEVIVVLPQTEVWLPPSSEKTIYPQAVIAFPFNWINIPVPPPPQPFQA